MKTLTAKAMNEGLKKGWCTGDFAADLGVSQDEFIVLLRKTFESRPLSGFMRKLAKNASAKKKGKKPCSTNTKSKNKAISAVSTDISDACNPEDVSYCISEEDSIIEDVNPCIEDVEVEVAPSSVTVAQIDAEIAANSIRLRGLETELVQLRARQRNNRAKLSDEEKWLERILGELKKHRDQAEEITSNLTILNDEIARKKAEKDDLTKKIASAKQKLSSLQKITILACNPDETTVESGFSDDEFPKYSFDYEEDKFNEILSSGDAEELTIREVKFVASLIRYCQILSASEREFEILFESQNIEKIFHQFF